LKYGIEKSDLTTAILRASLKQLQPARILRLLQKLKSNLLIFNIFARFLKNASQNSSMHQQLKTILCDIRELSIRRGLKNLTIEEICRELNIPVQTLYNHVNNETELVVMILDQERRNLQKIFEKYPYNGENAIDLLLSVGHEISEQFKDITLTISLELQKYFPDIYQHHLELRTNYIFTKIKNNLEHGIRQGNYRSDLSTELLARLYISRLLDLHNPLVFPPGEFSFNIVFDVMIDNFIRGIATEHGIAHYESRIKVMEFVMN
jgi:TetR/AcrR family transcriptional regulator, cholesterol catabolism regulator